MKAIGRRGTRARSSAAWWGRHARRALAAGLLTLLTSALLLLVGALGALPVDAQGQSAHHLLGPRDTPKESPSPTVTPTTAPAPTISLVSPSSAKGPAGASVTVSGNNFSGSTVQLFATTHADCSGSQTGLTTAGLTHGGFSNVTFFWPASIPTGTYYICGPGMSSGAPAYQELTQSPPTLSLSAPQANINDNLILTGTNFVGLPSGATVQLAAQSHNGGLQTLPSGVVNDSGAFTVPWTVNVTTPGAYTIIATSQQEGSAPPVLSASALLTVLQAQSTVTPSPTVSPTTTASGSGGGATSTGNSGGAGGLLLIVGAIIFAVLVILGVVAFVLLRGGKSGPGGQPGYPGGYDEVGAPYRPGGVSGPGFGTSGQYRRSGVHDPMDPYQDAPVGAVSQWDTTAAGPDANWQPRPMTGRGSYGGGGYPDYAPTEQQGWPQGGGGYPPADPWGNTRGGYGPPAGGGQQGYGGHGPGRGPYGDDQATTQGGWGSNYPPQQGYPQQGYPPQQPGYPGRPSGPGRGTGGPSGPGGQRRTPGQGGPSGPRSGPRPSPEDEQFGPWPDLGGDTR